MSTYGNICGDTGGEVRLYREDTDSRIIIVLKNLLCQTKKTLIICIFSDDMLHYLSRGIPNLFSI